MSAGATSLRISGRQVYGLAVGDPAAPLLRLSADDFEGLGLCRGLQVALDVPGRPTVAGYVESDTFVDPCWVWVQLAPLRRAETRPRRKLIRVPV